MGFRFYKSVNLGKGFRLNFSKSGVGYSFGTKGFRFTKRANSKSSSSGCLFTCVAFPFLLLWWIFYGTFWLMWMMVKLCFVLPIKYLIKLIKSKKQSN